MLRVIQSSNVVLLWLWQGPFLAGFEPVSVAGQVSYGLQRLDHAVGNAWEMEKTVNYLATMTGFHEFAEFTAEVRTVIPGPL